MLNDSIAMLDAMFGTWDLSYNGVLLVLLDLQQRGLQPTGPSINLQPSGIEFAVPVELSVPYLNLDDAAAAPSDVNARWLTAVHTSESHPTRLLRTTSIAPESGTVSFELEHFSDVSLTSFFQHYGQFVADLEPGPSPQELHATAELAAEFFLKAQNFTGEVIEAFSDRELIDQISDELVFEMLCAAEGNVDTGLPADLSDMNTLLAVLTLSPAPVGSLDFDDVDIARAEVQTGAEGPLLDALLAAEGQQSFADVFAIAVELNDRNAYDALLTMHNVGQSISRPGPEVEGWTENAYNKVTTQLLPKLEGYGAYDARIQDTRGAFYHMAGLATLGMRTGEGLPLFLGSVDEVLLSGVIGGGFELGEQIANQIGAQIAPKLMERAPGFDPSECFFVEIVSPDAGQSEIRDLTLRGRAAESIDFVSYQIRRNGQLYGNGLLPVVDGIFEDEIRVGIGENVIRVTASQDGETAEDEVTVLYEPVLHWCGGMNQLPPSGLDWCDIDGFDDENEPRSCPQACVDSPEEMLAAEQACNEIRLECSVAYETCTFAGEASFFVETRSGEVFPGPNFPDEHRDANQGTRFIGYWPVTCDDEPPFDMPFDLNRRCADGTLTCDRP